MYVCMYVFRYKSKRFYLLTTVMKIYFKIIFYEYHPSMIEYGTVEKNNMVEFTKTRPVFSMKFQVSKIIPYVFDGFYILFEYISTGRNRFYCIYNWIDPGFPAQ